MLQQTIRDLIPAVTPLGRGARRGCALVIAPDRALALTHTLSSEEVELRLAAADATVRGALAGSDALSGLSLLTGDFSSVAPAAFVASPPQLGDELYSLADPGSGLRVTRGAVSCTGVVIRRRSGRSTELLEHTAPVPSGAGGGPVAGADGRVIGISALRGGHGLRAGDSV